MSNYNYSLPVYFREYLRGKIDKINSLKRKIGKDAVTFAFISDFHICVNEKNSLPLLERVLSECDIPYFFNGGDIVSGVGICSDKFLIAEIDQAVGLFRPIERKCLYVEGNHDRAYSTFAPPDYYKENLSEKVFFKCYFSNQTQYSDRVFGEGCYYYVDDEKNRVRYIVLNSQDVPNEDKTEEGFAKYNTMTHFGFLQKQTEWFADNALRFSEKGWSVVVCSHVNPLGLAEEEHVYNYGIIEGILNAFNSGGVYVGEETYENSLFDIKISVDYRDNGGNVIAWLGGHTHRDDFAIVNAINCIEIASDAAYTDLHPERKATIKEQAIDVFVVDKKQKKVYVVRIGDGVDRDFYY